MYMYMYIYKVHVHNVGLYWRDWWREEWEVGMEQVKV